MKYDTFDLVKLVIIFASAVMLYFSLKELRVALVGSQASAETAPCSTPTPTQTVQPSATPTPSPSPTPSPLPAGTIFLTEFMACPTSGNEWLELYNASTVEVTFANWQVIDQSNNKKFISGTIAPQSFATFEWSGSLLNNTGDSFKVLDATGKEVGSAAYTECSTGISYTYQNGEWVGSLESAGEDTTVSENTVSTSSSAIATHESDFNLELTANDLSKVLDTSLSMAKKNSAPHKIPTLLAAQNGKFSTSEDSQFSTDPSTTFSVLPAISVIMGGLLQLLPGCFTLYEYYFKSLA